MKGVINIGAHFAEQYNSWVKVGVKHFLFIEPIRDNFQELINEFSDKHNVRLMNIALGSYKGKANMYVDPKHLSLSASILKPTGHIEDYPDVDFDEAEEVNIDRLDDIEYDRTLYDHIYITASGAEMEILKHGTESLKHIRTIKTQTYSKRLFEGCFLTEEMTEFLFGEGFALTGIENIGISWGYAYYKRI